MTDRGREIFFEIHSGLTREAPGDSQSTKKAFSMIAGIGPDAVALDIGCGPGGQTIDLVKISDWQIVAVDMSLTYLISLRERAAREKVADRVHAVNGDMLALGFREAAFDVVWAEGSIYIIGFERGLIEWKRFIKPGGYLAVTEVSWLRADPPDELKKYWAESYPAIQDIGENLKLIERSGYEIAGHFVLPESAWWDHYYSPIEIKLASLRSRRADDKAALEAIETELEEIDLYKRYSQYYGYVFYVARTG